MELEEGYNGSSAPGAQGGAAMSIIGAEDEDFENDIEPILMKHPAYLVVFIQHVVLQFDSSPVLLRVPVPNAVQEKRKMGMTPGEKELSELESYRTKDKGIREAKEKQLAEQLMVKLEEMYLNISTDEERSSAIYTAIVTYMKHLGVKTKTADNKKSKANFFRKKISGNKKQEEALKPKKGFSILDPARWNRGDSHSAEKTPAFDKKARLTEGMSGRSKGTPSVQDPSGLDSPALADTGDSPVAEQAVVGEQLLLDESAENERAAWGGHVCLPKSMAGENTSFKLQVPSGLGATPSCVRPYFEHGQGAGGGPGDVVKPPCPPLRTKTFCGVGVVAMVGTNCALDPACQECVSASQLHPPFFWCMDISVCSWGGVSHFSFLVSLFTAARAKFVFLFPSSILRVLRL
ncbi:hypothetical protein E2320_000735 [Naja naja]|nr:hypothetical protein E2320_000735 [Naja naja]